MLHRERMKSSGVWQRSSTHLRSNTYICLCSTPITFTQILCLYLYYTLLPQLHTISCKALEQEYYIEPELMTGRICLSILCLLWMEDEYIIYFCSTGWSAGTDKNYWLIAQIAQGRKQPIICDRCPLFH